MAWADLLSRLWRRPNARPAAVDFAGKAACLRRAAGMDYLLARAALAMGSEDMAADLGGSAVGTGDAVLPFKSLLEAGEQAQQREDWAVAEPIWAAMRLGYPQVFYGYTNGAAALCGLDRTDEAWDLLSGAAARFPDEPSIPHALGHLAMRRGDWTCAEAHWRAALRFAVRPWWVYTELSRALEEQGRLAEAEAVLLEGQEEDPGEPSLFINHARLAWQGEDWAAAVARWADANRRFPRSETLSGGLYQALMRLAESDPVAAERAQRDLGLGADAVAEDDPRALMLRFESLGGTGPAGGCEFGGVQRDNGAEPLGLFRWATVTPASLTACLEGRFEGMGEAATTTLSLHHDLWEIVDTAYGTSMHSFVAASEVPEDRMAVVARKRMRFLKEKLIADLESAAKIFVLKLGERMLAADEAAALGRALRRYGPNVLLCVCSADQAHPAGEIVAAAPGVFVGAIDFSGGLDVAGRRPAWEMLCRKMVEKSGPGAGS